MGVIFPMPHPVTKFHIMTMVYVTRVQLMPILQKIKPITQVSFWGLSEHRAAEKREAQVKEVQREN